MIVAVCAQKGGVGKTTTAICLADEWHRRGHGVTLIDADPQGTSQTWADQRDARDLDGPTVARAPADYHEHVEAHAPEVDHIVIDCPPGDASPDRLAETPRQRSALVVADLAVIPCGTGVNDVWSVHGTVELVKEAQQARPDLDARLLVTQHDARTVIGDQTREALEAVDLSVLDTTLGDRVAYQEMPGSGVGVTRYDPSGKAADEVQSLVDEIEATEGTE
jgi:chromosome partitioning protein